MLCSHRVQKYAASTSKDGSVSRESQGAAFSGKRRERKREIESEPENESRKNLSYWAVHNFVNALSPLDAAVNN